MTDLSVIVLGLYAIFNLKEFSFKIIPKYFCILFFIFYIFILLRSSFSSHILLSLESSLFYFRYFFFIIGGILLINDNKKLIIYFLLILLVVCLFLVLDSLYQFFLSNTYKTLCTDNAENCRISSLFNDEFIMGSFITRMMPMIIISIMFFSRFNIKPIFIQSTILVIVFISLISGERNAFLLSIIGYFFISLNFISNKNFIFYSISSLIIIILFLFFNTNVHKRLIGQTLNEMLQSNNKDHFVIISSVYDDLYRNSFTLFLEKPLLGHGPKTFREVCKKNIEIYPEGCSTHPHNIYLQLLSETGVIGTMFIIFIFLFFLKKILNLYKKIGFKKNLTSDKIEKYYLITINILCVSFIINFFPLSSSGNFFNNLNSCIYYLPLIFIWGIKKETINIYAKK